MKLSEAIELYFKDHPERKQIRDDYFDHEEGCGKAACAVGAALYVTQEPGGTLFFYPDTWNSQPKHMPLDDFAEDYNLSVDRDYVASEHLSKMLGFPVDREYVGAEHVPAEVRERAHALKHVDVVDVVILLNDSAKWTWQQIVEWLRREGY